MQAIAHAYLLSIIVIFLYTSVAFIVSRLAFRKRNDFADVAWGGGFVVIVLASFFNHYHANATNVISKIVVILVCIWGLRLATHIWRRFIKSDGDRRYKAMEAKWGKHVERNSYLIVFLMQGLLMLLIAAPVVVAESTAHYFSPWMLVGIVLWLIGFYFEAIGDAQLSKFLSNPAHKGQLMTDGLWRYSRHPNYFGEISQWWGLGLIALCVPYGWLGLVGSITISVLIIFISGVPGLERHYAGRPDWEAYKARTSMLVPWPPRRVRR